jgi:ATP-dependent exoDNAse (exonuclease V) beta subunit
LLVAPIKAKGAGNDQPSTYDYLKKLEAERAAHEDERLLYVAATRAIRRLHLVGIARADDNKDEGVKAPAAGTLLKLLWPGVALPVFIAALAQEHSPASRTAGVDPASFVPPLLRLAETGLPAALQDAEVLSRPAANNPLDLDLPETGLLLEASVGTLVHRCLELIAGQGVARWSPERVVTLAAVWQRWLQHQGHNAADAAAGAAEAIAGVQTTLACETGRWLLAAHPEAAAEQAWSSRLDNVAVNHVIDRIFVADGERWIVDYKTVRLPEAELPQRAEHFRPQLERYASLFRDDPRPLRLAIYFPLQGRLIELDKAPCIS